MNKNSELALQTIKKVLDRAVQRGNIFMSTDEVVDSINAYNYLVKQCMDESVPKLETNAIPN